MKYILRMFRYIPGEHFRIVGLVIFSVVAGVFNTAIPLLLSRTLTAATQSLQNNNFRLVYQGIILVVVLIISEQVLMFFKEKISDTFRMQLITKLRFAIYPKLFMLDLNYIEKHQPGAIQHRIDRGVNDFSQWIFDVTEWTGTLVTTTIFMLVVLWFKSPFLGLIFTITVPIMVAVSLKKNKAQKPYIKKGNRLYEGYAGAVNETLSHFETIKTMSAEITISKKFRKICNALRQSRLVQFQLQRRYNFSRDFIGAIGTSLALLTTIYLVTKKSLNIGDILLVSLYARSLTNSIRPFGWFIQRTGETENTSKRVIDFLELKPEFPDKEGAHTLTRLNDLKFSNVTFDYVDGKKGAVKNLDFDITDGKTIALVGPSGVGKSTITKLIIQFYRPTRGNVFINNVPADDFKADSIRTRIGMVLQDVALFNTTILENLQIANTKASEKDIISAARQAHAHEFIKDLPKGYKTLVGERGVKLSGGQKQRIAIARAILKDPDLIILDEATSALDSESERLVQSGLKQLMQGRSALIIAHRLSTVMHADEILVLQKGKVVERGTHQHLLKQNGLYAHLFKLQSATGKVEL